MRINVNASTDTKVAKKYLSRMCYAYLIKRMRNKKVSPKEKTMISLKVVCSDISRQQEHSGSIEFVQFIANKTDQPNRLNEFLKVEELS